MHLYIIHLLYKHPRLLQQTYIIIRYKPTRLYLTVTQPRAQTCLVTFSILCMTQSTQAHDVPGLGNCLLIIADLVKCQVRKGELGGAQKKVDISDIVRMRSATLTGDVKKKSNYRHNLLCTSQMSAAVHPPTPYRGATASRDPADRCSCPSYAWSSMRQRWLHIARAPALARSEPRTPWSRMG